MRRLCTRLITGALLLCSSGPMLHSAGNPKSGSAAAVVPVHSARLSPLDLEVGGDLAGLPPGTTLYVSRDALLTLPQTVFTATDDANFTASTQISGVPLQDLFQQLGAAPDIAWTKDVAHATKKVVTRTNNVEQPADVQ